VISLNFSEDLNNCLLQTSFGHQLSVTRCGKSLLLDLDRFNWSHPVPQLVVLSSHELALVDGEILDGFVFILKNNNTLLLFKLNFI